MVSFDINDEYYVQINKFSTNDRICPYVIFTNREDNLDEPYAKMATNLPERPLEENQFFLDYYLIGDTIISMVAAHKFFKRTHVYVQEKMVQYEIWEYLGPMRP